MVKQQTNENIFSTQLLLLRKCLDCSSKKVTLNSMNKERTPRTKIKQRSL